MRYRLESTLPINAFSPRGKGPFSRGMTLEGGGSINPVRAVTDLGSSVADIGTKAVKAVVQPVYNATLKQIPGVDQALVNLDKSVAKAIPGGWGTIGSVAASFVPGVGPMAMAGIGALNGSGVMRGNHQFNLQGAIMGGALAYGASNLAQGLETAGTPTDKLVAENIVDAGTKTVPQDAIESLNASQGWTGVPQAPAPSAIPASAINAANATQGINPATGLSYGSVVGDTLSGTVPTPTPSIGSQLLSGDIGGAASQVGSNISEGATNAMNSVKSGIDTLTNPETYSNLGTKASELGSGTLENMSNAVSGAKNLLTGASSVPASMTLTNTALPIIAGASGLAALEEQKKYLEEQATSGAVSNSEYNAEMAKINAEIETAKKTVSDNPLQSSVDIGNVKENPSLYARNKDTLYNKNSEGGRLLYAAGGQVGTPPSSQINPPDDQTNTPNQSPISQIGAPDYTGGLQSLFAGLRGLGANQAQPQTQPPQNFADVTGTSTMQPTSQPFSGGFPSQLGSGTSGGFSGGFGLGSGGSGSQSAFPLQGQYGIVKMAAGGMAPRFLSGGGDGMSDSIPANIGGTQEARLADGEFVIPADVVSHLGNGSSKAGAKQLYSMMDKVRQARTGTKKQGKQINPRKYLAA
jgi:hypothetical protein